MCEALSPGGRLRCSNPKCDGRSHVWEHESAAHDAKADADGNVDY